jgi:hypothetical protein
LNEIISLEERKETEEKETIEQNKYKSLSEKFEEKDMAEKKKHCI